MIDEINALKSKLEQSQLNCAEQSKEIKNKLVKMIECKIRLDEILSKDLSKDEIINLVGDAVKFLDGV